MELQKVGHNWACTHIHRHTHTQKKISDLYTGFGKQSMSHLIEMSLLLGHRLAILNNLKLEANHSRNHMIGTGVRCESQVPLALDRELNHVEIKWSVKTRNGAAVATVGIWAGAILLSWQYSIMFSQVNARRVSCPNSIRRDYQKLCISNPFRLSSLADFHIYPSFIENHNHEFNRF